MLNPAVCDRLTISLHWFEYFLGIIPNHLYVVNNTYRNDIILAGIVSDHAIKNLCCTHLISHGSPSAFS